MKELDKDGNLVIYSNWDTSKKAQDIRSNNQAALTFFWKELERQVRIEGVTEFLSNEESQIYFDTRPRASRLGAWASPQSQVLHNRAELEERCAEQQEKFKDVEHIPCPPLWGGLRIRPLEWEFFQGRKNRTHDRFVFTRNSVDDKKWTVERIAP
jgi:pyridoxamine 5'-phosphate oxidase